MRTVLLLVSLSLTACAPLTAADRAALRQGGICIGVSLARAAASAVLDIALNTPSSEAEWGAWGKQLAAKHGADPLKCALDVVAAVTEQPAMMQPRVIGFQPAPSGPTAGPVSPSSGEPVVGAVSVAPPHAVAFARWMRGQ